MEIAMTHFQTFHFQGQGGLHKLLILDDARDCLLPLHRDDSKTAQLTPIKSNMCLSPSQSQATSEFGKFEKKILSLFLCKMETGVEFSLVGPHKNPEVKFVMNVTRISCKIF